MVQPNVKTAVIAAANENRSLSSCMAPSFIIACRGGIPRRPPIGSAAPHASVGAVYLRGQLFHRTVRGSDHLGTPERWVSRLEMR
jgi:hypothetical protein